MNIFLRAIAAVLLSCALCEASDRQRDGNWWRGQRGITKYAYLMGVADGMDTATDLEKVYMDKEKLIQLQNNISALIGKSTVAQVADGLDVFYQDFRNRNIQVSKAFWIVTMSTVGDPHDETEAATEKQRREAATKP